MENQIVTINPSLQKNLDLLNAFKAQVDEMGENCKKIVVKDEDSVAIATQNLSKANSLLKLIQEKVKVIRKPYNDELKKIGEVGSEITSVLEGGVNDLKSRVAEWEKDRQAKEKKKQEILDYIAGGLKDKLQKLYEGCKTAEDCNAALVYIKTRFPADDKFGEFVKEAHALRDNYIALMEAVKSGDMITVSALKESAAEATESILEVRQSVSMRSDASKTRGTRMTWDFELADITKVPIEWLTIDEVKVKEYLSENKSTLTDGEVVNGVKFYKKIGISA